MVAAIAVGVGAVGGILGAYTVIDRTIQESFDSTSPAAATIQLTEDVSADAALALEVSGVDVAEPRREATVRLSSADSWQPLTLVSVGAFGEWRIGRAFPESGAWPPTRGQIVIERASLREVDVAVGDTIEATTPQGGSSLSVVGLAHDPGRTPAWMTGQVIGYVSPQTLADVGVAGGLNQLAIHTASDLTRDQNRAIADAVARTYEAHGYRASGVTVPVPGEHPARGVMGTLLYLLQAFGIVALIAAVALVTTLVVAEVKRSTGQIAVMKIGGATAAQVTRVYLAALGLAASAGLAVGVVGGMAVTWGLSRFAFLLLNLDATSFLASWWVFPLQAVVALAVPLAAVTVPVRRLSRAPVRDGIASGATAPARNAKRTAVAPRVGRAISMGSRNAVRQPGRLALTAVSLAVGAAATMAALNTGGAWDRIVSDEFDAQNFDVQVRLTAPIPQGSLDRAASDAGLTRFEYWNAATVSVTGPDGHVGDDVLALSPPTDSTSATFPLVDGRRLAPGDDHTVVLTQSLTDPAVGVGDTITLAGDRAPWTVVGVVRQLSGGQEGAVWVSQPLSSMAAGTATMLRVTGTSEAGSLDAIEAILADAGVGIASATTATDAKQSLDDHLYIITGLLLVMSIGLGVVGLLGLVEAMSTAVAERRGEIALMKTVGASSAQIMRMVVTEAIAVIAIAMAGSIVLALGLTALVENAVGSIFVGAALPYTWWPPGVGIAAVLMTAAGAASSIVPAYEAADMPVREALARG
jgi:putative ABC transport system permease protein